MSPETAELVKLRGDELIAALLNRIWYAKPDDLIGGWCVMPVDESPSGGCVEVASFLSEELARHIVALHNTLLYMMEE